jgi:TPR repeat protein
MNKLKSLVLTFYALVAFLYYLGALGNSLENQTSKMQAAQQATTPVKTTSPSAFQPSASQVASKTTSAALPLPTTASNASPGLRWVAPTTQMPLSQPPVPAREVPPKRSGSENRLEVNTTEVLGFEQALQLADAGDARAQAIVSIYYGVGYKAKKDATKAADYAKRSANQRNPLGIYRVAAMMENGDGFEKDIPQAKKLKEIAFEGLNSMSGDPYALTALGIMLFRGEGGLNQNREQAVALYRKAADLGYAPAQYNYSAALALGQGVSKNEQESLKWWRRAYEQNYPPAMDGPVGQVSSNLKPTENPSSARSSPPKPRSNQKLPQGIPVSGSPGFVASPYAPGAGFIDARGMSPGSIATCPFTKEPFIIPAM